MKSAILLLILGCLTWTNASAVDFQLLDASLVRSVRAERQAARILSWSLESEFEELEAQRKQLLAESTVAEAERERDLAAARMASFLFERSYRVWTTLSGTRVLARPVRHQAGQLRIRTPDGRELGIGISSLAIDDRTYLDRVALAASATALDAWSGIASTTRPAPPRP